MLEIVLNKFFAMYQHWSIYFWIVAVGVMLPIELICVFTKGDAPFTAVIREFIPIYFRAMILGWLWLHFVIDPRNYK